VRQIESEFAGHASDKWAEIRGQPGFTQSTR
jgi:hypothetical protein